MGQSGSQQGWSTSVVDPSRRERVNHKLVQHPSGNKLKSLNTLVTAELLGFEHGSLVALGRAGHHHLTHVDGSINNKMINHNTQQLGIEVVDVVEAVFAVEGGTVVLLQVLADGLAVELDQNAKLVHLCDTVVALEPGLRVAGQGQQ